MTPTPVRYGSVVVRHNFETAHRLPFLGGKCTNLHGHSWWAEITVTGRLDLDGVLCEFGALKASVRAWIDTYLDHGAMLGTSDPLIASLTDEGSKVFAFGVPGQYASTDDEALAADLTWPTVENVAELLRRVTLGLLPALPGVTYPALLRVDQVHVQETHVNAAVAR